MLPIYVFLMCFAGKPCRCYNFGRHPCFPWSTCQGIDEYEDICWHRSRTIFVLI
jgi:hypothetical protein